MGIKAGEFGFSLEELDHEKVIEYFNERILFLCKGWEDEKNHKEIFKSIRKELKQIFKIKEVKKFDIDAEGERYQSIDFFADGFYIKVFLNEKDAGWLKTIKWELLHQSGIISHSPYTGRILRINDLQNNKIHIIKEEKKWKN